MAVWVEDLTQSSFKICLREVKIFDGFHQNIKVVSNFDSACLLLNSKFFTLKQINPTKIYLLISLFQALSGERVKSYARALQSVRLEHPVYISINGDVYSEM